MGGKSSKPKPPPPNAFTRFFTDIFVPKPPAPPPPDPFQYIVDQISVLNSQVTKLKQTQTNLISGIFSYNNYRIPPVKNANASLTSTNSNLYNKNQNIITTGESDISNLNNQIDNQKNANEGKRTEITTQIGQIDNINKDIKRAYNAGNLTKETILVNYLYDIDTVQNTYYSILNQNNNINYYNSQIYKNSHKNIQKDNYVSEQISEMDNIDTIFFIIYYLLFIIFCYLIIFKRKLTIIFKIIIIILSLFYPIVIFFIESSFYNLITFLYLNVFSIYRIENID